MAVAGSFDDAIRKEHEDALGSLKRYWDALEGFLTGLKIEGVSVSAAGFKASLKSDPTFKERLQKTMAGHLGALVADVREFCVSRVAALRAHTDEPWLAAVCQTHEAELQSLQELPSLARFFDTHLVLCYRNGDEWYDVHPLIAEHVQAQAAALDPPTDES